MFHSYIILVLHTCTKNSKYAANDVPAMVAEHWWAEFQLEFNIGAITAIDAIPINTGSRNSCNSSSVGGRWLAGVCLDLWTGGLVAGGQHRVDSPPTQR